jgi:hypothetical protein
MAYSKEVRYDEFFPIVEDNLRRSLPAGLNEFEWWQRPGKNFIRVRYRSFKMSYYELQFSDHSSHHSQYFGEGPHIILAFYYEASFEKRSAWFNAITPYVDHICEQLGKTVKSGHWGKKWACLITNLDDERLTPEHFTSLIASFIQATYLPITLAFKNMRQ